MGMQPECELRATSNCAAVQPVDPINPAQPRQDGRTDPCTGGLELTAASKAQRWCPDTFLSCSARNTESDTGSVGGQFGFGR